MTKKLKKGKVFVYLFQTLNSSGQNLEIKTTS